MPKKPEDAVLTAVNDTVARIRKRFGADSAIVPSEDDPRSQVRGVVLSGIDVVDRYVLGCGGLPLGRMVEIYSEPGVAKTAFAWTSLGGCIRAGGLAIYCDSEQSWDTARATVYGVDPSRMVLLQPLTMEQALEEMEATLADLDFKGPVLLVWDSLAEAPFKGDKTGNYEKESADNRAKMIGRFCRSTATMAPAKQACILIVNQVRQKRGVIFGDKMTTPGGDAPKYYASLRLQLFSGKSLKNEHGQHIGKSVTFMAMKSRFSQPFRKAKVRLDYAKGWDNLWSTISHAKDLDLIPAGSKYNADTYVKAVEALKWEGASIIHEMATTDGVVEVEDEREGEE